jgi:phosphotriesterase-related protein
VRSHAGAYVMTVAGPISPDDLGCTLVHEHLHCDWRPMISEFGYERLSEQRLTLATAAEARWNPNAYLDNYDVTDVDLIVEELAPFRAAGGRAVVETTPSGMGRSPQALREIAERADVRVVMGCGYYIEPHPESLAARSADDVAAELVREIRHGVDDTGIRPGIIGEIGTGPGFSTAEEKVLRAAAWAQRETGLALTIHLHPWHKNGARVLDLLDAEGVAPERVILNHLTTAFDDDAYQRSLLDRGVYLAYDLFGFDHSLIEVGRYAPNDRDVAAKVVELAGCAFLERLLVSQDVGVRTRLRAYGGWSYDHLLRHVVPLLLELGLDGAQVDTLLVENPRRVLATKGEP